MKSVMIPKHVQMRRKYSMILKNVEKKEHNTAVFTVAADSAEFEKAVNGAYLKNKKDVYIPGFRKGKAPRQVIEGMYGKEVFYQEAVFRYNQNRSDEGGQRYERAGPERTDRRDGLLRDAAERNGAAVYRKV